MQQTVQPIAKIPLHMTPAGDTYNPELVFSPDGSALYVRQPVVLLEGWDWVRWNSPEFASVTLIVIVVWLVWLTRRVIGRKQELGCVYCRRCNYELTPPIADEVRAGRAEWLSAEAKCPECGKRAKTPVVGRLRRWRLVPWLLAGGLVAIGCALILGFSLVPFRPFEGPTWPVAGVERWARGLAFQKERSRFPMKHLLTKWETATGKKLATLAHEHVYGMNNGALSPDGKMWVMGCWNYGGERPELVLVDAASGARRAVAWSEPPNTPGVIGFSADSKEAMVQTTVMGSSGTTVTLDAVNIETLQRRLVASVDVPPRLVPTAMEATYPYYLIDPAHPERIVLVVAQQAGGTGGVAAEITVIEGEQRRKISGNWAGQSWHTPRWAGDGIVEIPIYRGTQNAQIDIGSGTVSMVNPPAQRVIAGDVEAAIAKGAVVPTGAGDLVISLGGAVSGAVASHDGKFVASPVTRQRKGTPPNSRRPRDWSTEVWVWRLGE